MLAQLSEPLAEGAGWREVNEVAPPVPSRPWSAPRKARWESSPMSGIDVLTWVRIVAEAERVFGSGVEVDTDAGREWSPSSPHPFRLGVHAEQSPEVASLAVTVTWPAPRPWVPALAWLCVPTALVVAVVLLSRWSTGVEWMAVLALVCVPLVAAGLGWAAAWARHAAMRWRVQPLLRGASRAADRGAPDDVVWIDALAGEPVPSVVLLPGAVAPAEWLSADEIDSLFDAHPAPADLRRARRAIAQATIDRQSEVVLPEGFTEWRPRRAS